MYMFYVYLYCTPSNRVPTLYLIFWGKKWGLFEGGLIEGVNKFRPKRAKFYRFFYLNAFFFMLLSGEIFPLLVHAF